MIKQYKIKAYILLSIILFFIIFAIEKTKEIKSSNIEEITLNKINHIVKIEAYLKKQTIIKNHSFFTFTSKNKAIKAALFNNNISLKKKKYEIIGKITPNENQPQLIIYELKQLHQ